MKTPSILILCTALLVSMPSTDAQSFKDGLKSLGDKIGKQIVKTTQSVKNQTTGSKPTTSKPTSDNRLLRGFIGGSSFYNPQLSRQ